MIVKYTLPARILHWLTALAIISAFALGLTTGGMEGFSLQKLQLINYHKWIGITVLGLVAIRLLWRLSHRPPALPANMAKWERQGAHLAHMALYVLMFAVPLGGWLYSSAKGFPVVWLGLVKLPDLMEKNEALAHTIKEMHELGAWVLIALAVAHAAAALKHHFIQRDDVLKRML
ncbi:cytochrome b [Chitinimonas sp. BJB300]|uniref:cytochrome b n=1 Tax=Chitinimonas sp. BJB300 TaxID=1559339 RepID=UPI000C0DF180|nr:cytochrome b [Chitinimonas sp. BJB300]PHV10625.1 cytochrome b [Chitinimonas sp. BJB300]TSJ87845.1 cytochrome b [Chitinimonas sp. BJB300]